METFVVSSSVIDPVKSIVTDNIEVLLPAGLGITALVVGARLVPRLFKAFVRA